MSKKMQAQRSLEVQDKRKHEPFTISQIARMTGVNVKAIRYYESIGLLPRPARFDNQYRRYSMVDVNRLILLRRIRCLGVPLMQAKTLLIGASDARCLDVQQELLKLVEARLISIDQEISELHRLRDEMESYQRKLFDCHPNESEAFQMCADMSCIAVSNENFERKEERI